MYLFGASGHAKVIIDILQKSNIEIIGLFDKDPRKKELQGLPVLGDYNGHELDKPVIICIGDNKLRQKISEQVKAFFGKAIYADAIISPS
ncbi:MAG: PglD-related sugar-binding protein, partial [Bacteroidia bacterium]